MVILTFSSPKEMNAYHPVLDKNFYHLSTIMVEGKSFAQTDVVKLLKKFVIRLPSTLILYFDSLQSDFFSHFTQEEIYLFSTVKTLFIRLTFGTVEETTCFINSIASFFPYLKKLKVYIDQVQTLTEKAVLLIYRKTRFDGFVCRFSRGCQVSIKPTFIQDDPDRKFCLPNYLIEGIRSLSKCSESIVST
jgi:hypothetical protein